MSLVRHIVVFRFGDGFTEEENRINAQKVKEELEGLKSVISGIVNFTVYIDSLPSSNMDVVIDSTFESKEALAAYQVHPEHVRVSAFVGSVLRDRRCIDYYGGKER